VTYASHDVQRQVAFIGDHFGLAISGTKVTRYLYRCTTSNVTADEGAGVYYQQQVLSTVDRSTIGL
jgi:hypothetical protein